MEEDREFPLVGEDIIEDSRNMVKEAKLYRGTCTMEGCCLGIGIKKGPGIKKGTYNILQSIQHNTLIPLRNFYSEGNQGRFVIPTTDMCFEHWLKQGGSELLFDVNGQITTLFKTIIIDICDVIEKLQETKILVKNFDCKNLYIANEVHTRILVLVTEAEVFEKAVSKHVIWNPVKNIINLCCTYCNLSLTDNARRYLDFIGSNKFTVKALRIYPENWDSFMKGDYLFALMAAKHSEIRADMKVTGISWPLENGELPEVLSWIIDEQSKQGYHYNSNIPFDYVNLIRNLYKHFDKLPYYIKNAFQHSREGLIKQLDLWTPTLWQDLYDVIGWP